jgi:flavin reductase (DIM6/NTAB) family NADH-FMN oxidoreductase RutF
MIVDPQSISPGSMYRFMISVVVPRPIAFVSTVGADGGLNVAPFSYFMALSSRPPLVGIAMNLRAGEPKDTLRNLRGTGDFVVNVVDEPLLERMVHASGDWPGDVSEFDLTGLTPQPSERVRSPRVAESPVHLECRVEREVTLGETSLVVGEILLAHVSDAVLSDGRVDVLKLHPVGRLGGDGYSIVRDVIHQPRPKAGTAGS